MARLKDSFHPYAALTIAGWSLAYVLTRMALPYFSPLALAVVRYLFASLALLVVVLVRRIRPPKPRDLGWFALAGVCGFTLYVVVFNKGSQTVTAATSSVVIATVPVMTALLASVVFKERLAPLQWAGTLVSFAGVAVLTVLEGGLAVNAGILWLLLAAVLLSSYNLMLRRLTRSYPALDATAYCIFIGTLLYAPFMPGAIGELVAAPPVAWMYVALMGVFCSAVAYVSWSTALAKAKRTSAVSNYMFVTPFVTSVLGFLMAGEAIDLATLVGGAIILGGMALYRFGGR